VSTAEAAARLGLSRYYVAEKVRLGRLDGYGVRRHEGGRIRWHVYEDALPSRDSAGPATGRVGVNAEELLTHLLEARECARLARIERRHAKRLLIDAADVMASAIQAVARNETDRVTELLLMAHGIRNDEERRLLLAEQHEADAEACLDTALRSVLPWRKEVDPHDRESPSLTSLNDIRVPGANNPYSPDER
jgi:hypothetical protein